MWSVDVSPPKDQERLPTVVPKSEMFEKKRNQVITWTGGGEETHKCGERRSRTVHNWHAAGGFHCPPPLPLCMQRRIYGSRKGQPTPPPGGHHHCCCCCCCCIFAFCVPALRFYLVSVPFQEEKMLTIVLGCPVKSWALFDSFTHVV